MSSRIGCIGHITCIAMLLDVSVSPGRVTASKAVREASARISRRHGTEPNRNSTSKMLGSPVGYFLAQLVGTCGSVEQACSLGCLRGSSFFHETFSLFSFSFFPFFSLFSLHFSILPFPLPVRVITEHVPIRPWIGSNQPLRPLLENFHCTGRGVLVRCSQNPWQIKHRTGYPVRVRYGGLVHGICTSPAYLTAHSYACS